ncbi:MAG: TIGR03862 family flavoprotein [Caulobacterales bacterium]|nr:TIGR03862 family flavoprotein [Caulobacterales bacterium]
MSAPVHIIGAGPAGLMAAETLAARGHRVVVHDRMPSVARKFLMAGRGGLNLTHAEGLQDKALFLSRYGQAAGQVAPWLERLGPAELIAWVEALGQPTFVGGSGRVFPKTMKASPLLRVWLARLDQQGVVIRTRSHWIGWRDEQLVFETPEGERREDASAIVLALGGTSWPRLGSDGGWVGLIGDVRPFKPSNMGVDIGWSEIMRERFAGSPLKGIALSHRDQSIRGEAMISRYGLEGGAIYALSAPIREAVVEAGSTQITLDLKPDLSMEILVERLQRSRGRDTLTNHLRKAAGLSPQAVALLREPAPLRDDPRRLGQRIKALRLTVTGVQGLERAISSAGGVAWSALDESLMLKDRPGVFVAGEMLDWEAPTGGYLLTACLASGAVAGDGVADWLKAGAGWLPRRP